MSLGLKFRQFEEHSLNGNTKIIENHEYEMCKSDSFLYMEPLHRKNNDYIDYRQESSVLFSKMYFFV